MEDDNKKAKSELIQELDALRRRVHVLESSIPDAAGSARRDAHAQDAQAQLAHELGERVKELRCLYGLSRLMETPGISLPEILQGAVELLPPAWQYPALACARLVWNEQLHQTPNFRETCFRQSSDIRVQGKKEGAIEVFYAERPSVPGREVFLTEEQELLDVTAERIGHVIEQVRAEEILQEQEKNVELNLAAMNRLHDLAMTSIRREELQPLYMRIVDAAIAISNADFGNIQIVEPGTGDLKIVAHRGFPEEWIEFWNSVSKGQGACSTALERRERVLIEDVEQSPMFAGKPALEVQLKAGVRAIQSTPLVSDAGRVLGMFSTHYRTPMRFDESMLRFLDLLARQAAELIEHANAITGLRESEERYEALFRRGATPAVLLRLPDVSIEDVNEATEGFTGFTKAEMVGRTAAELNLLKPDDRAKTVRLFQSQGSLHVFEQRLFTKSGEERVILLNTNQLSIGGQMYALSTMQDITERKRAEELLATERSQLRTILSEFPYGVYIVDRNCDIQYINPPLESEFGPIQGRKCFEYFHDRQAPCPWCKNPDVFAGNTVRWEWTSMKTNKVYDLLDTPIVNSDGTISNLEFLHDITELKKTKEGLLQLAGRLNLALTSARAGVWDWNIETNEMFWDDRMLDLYGHTRETFPGGVEAWEQGLHPDDSAKAIDESSAALRGERDYDTEFRVRHHDGTVIHIKANGLVQRDEEGNPVRMIGLNVDITERKRMEADLQKFFLLAENSSEFIGMCDLDMNPVYVNPAGRRMVGLPDMAAACRIKVQDYYFPEDQVFIRDEFFPRVLREGHGEVEIRLRHFQTGEPIWMAYCLFHLCEASGTPIGWATVSRDITERKRMDAEQEKLQAQLAQAQKMESVGRLAGGVAHDFNNMLQVILISADHAQSQSTPGSPVYESLSEIINSANRSSDLTRQLLAFARKQTVAPKVLDLNETISGMLKMLQRLIGEDIDLAWLPGGDLGPVKMDPSQIDQILANLCVNARDAIEGVGKVTIETGKAAFDEAYCAAHAGFVPGDYVMLAVSDNGCGMDAETLGHLFEPFFTTKEMGRGTGLGLATVYGVVKQNNGFINVYSEPGQGTTFRIYLLRHLAKADRPVERAPDKPAGPGHETILLVEDDSAILKMITMILKGAGYTVLSTGTPGEAIRLASEYAGTIHLLMTDVVMPEMNGRDLAANILSLYPDIKRLFMSGYTANVIAHHGVLDEGVNFIPKPFSRNDLVTKLREVLDRE